MSLDLYLEQLNIQVLVALTKDLFCRNINGKYALPYYVKNIFKNVIEKIRQTER